MTALEPGRDPWRTVASREVYRNPWITVTEHDVIRPDGEPGLYGVVAAKVAVGVVALTDDDRVVLVGQWRYALDQYSWELVEGGVDEGEDHLEAAARELAEEAGLVADVWEPLLGPVALSNSFTSERGYLVVARGLRAVDRAVASDPTEELAVATVPFDDVVGMVLDGTIDDALTVMGILALDRRRRDAVGS